MIPALETRDLRKAFGGVTATDGVSLTLEPGARRALIGPNGAGKTTLVNLLTGVVAADAGHILLQGLDITRMPADARARRGLARTFQINQLFGDMTPLEALGLAIGERDGDGGRWWLPAGNRRTIAEVLDVAKRFRLHDALDARTSSLPYGKRRLLEIALAFASRPSVLLLDEPAAGVPEGERAEILSAVAALPPAVSVLLIEHDMDVVFSFADRISVLVNGSLLTEGTPDEIAGDPRVRAVYLGEHAVE